MTGREAPNRVPVWWQHCRPTRLIHAGGALPDANRNVNPDCSFTGEINLTISGKSTTAPVRGVFFDQGKKFYGLNMNPAFSFAQGERIDQ
jgi:hypothetical protein